MDNNSFIFQLITFVLVIIILLSLNSCSAKKWNNGVCPNCHEYYELYAVKQNINYYRCPNCGQKVGRIIIFGG